MQGRNILSLEIKEIKGLPESNLSDGVHPGQTLPSGYDAYVDDYANYGDHLAYAAFGDIMDGSEDSDVLESEK